MRAAGAVLRGAAAARNPNNTPTARTWISAQVHSRSARCGGEGLEARERVARHRHEPKQSDREDRDREVEERPRGSALAGARLPAVGIPRDPNTTSGIDRAPPGSRAPEDTRLPRNVGSPSVIVGIGRRRRRRLDCRRRFDFPRPASPSARSPPPGSRPWRRFFVGFAPRGTRRRPASQASFIARAIAAGSRAEAIAVFNKTPSTPSSIAIATSEAVPTPASTMIGIRALSTMRRTFCGFRIPWPLPIGEPAGITAATPASSRRRARIGSSLVYTKTRNPSFTSARAASSVAIGSGSKVFRRRGLPASGGSRAPPRARAARCGSPRRRCSSRRCSATKRIVGDRCDRGRSPLRRAQVRAADGDGDAVGAGGLVGGAHLGERAVLPRSHE